MYMYIHEVGCVLALCILQWNSARAVPSKALYHKCLIKGAVSYMYMYMYMQDSGSIGREDLHIQFHQKSSRAASD